MLVLQTRNRLKNDRINFELDTTSTRTSTVADVFDKLSQISGWANGRDIETVASRTIVSVLGTPKNVHQSLSVTWSNVLNQLTRMLTERENRAANPGSSSTSILSQMLQQLDNQPCPSPGINHSADVARAPTVPKCEEIIEEDKEVRRKEEDARDAGVSDAIWQQLQSDKILQEREDTARDRAVVTVKANQTALAQKASEEAARVEELRKQAAIDDEARRIWEEMRIKAAEAKRRADEEARRARELIEEI